MFKLLKTDGKARLGELHTAHGTVYTPLFMNVGTQAAIKGGLSAADLLPLKCQVELCNTYHLHIRPGDDVIFKLGGLHRFMNRSGPVLTDSGGFQVFSLAKLRNISDEGVQFSSHTDGRPVFLSPEKSVQIQANLGSDIAMAFDECVANPSSYSYVLGSAQRTAFWLERCKSEFQKIKLSGSALNQSQQLFGINQGGIYHDIRVENMKRIRELELDGYAIGGLAVGEEAGVMYEIIECVEEYMPQYKPRYLMGVGTPDNIIQAVSLGVDMFDCVMPSRNARHGHVFTKSGVRNLKNKKYELDDCPIDDACSCPVCTGGFSRAYIRHLFKAQEMLAFRLCVQHNLFFYNQLMEDIRNAIADGCFGQFKRLNIGKYSKRI